MKYLILFFFLLVPLASASQIVGDVYINSQGAARFDLITQEPLEGLSFEDGKVVGVTEHYTSKQSGVWMFTLNLQEYERILVDVHLPQNTQTIERIDGAQHILLLETNTISIIDEGKLFFEVRYTTKEERNYIPLYAIAVIILISLVLLTTIFIYKKQERKQRLHHIMPIVPEKEELIIKELMKGPQRQKALRNKLELPKASFSRYILHLEEKGIITREGEGRNKLLKLKK